MATSRKKAQKLVARKTVTGPAPIEYIRVTAENASADVRRAYQERKGVLVNEREVSNEAFSKALEDLMVEIGLDHDEPPIVAVASEGSIPRDLVRLTDGDVEEQLRQAEAEGKAVIEYSGSYSEATRTAIEAWQERRYEEFRRRVRARGGGSVRNSA